MALFDSIYSKMFVLNNLTAQKCGELCNLAVRIRITEELIN